jgi:hypothetical protein
MHEIQKIDLEGKPPQDQASYSEESSTPVSAQILIPLIEDDVYSISDLFSKFHTKDIMHASQDSHAKKNSCAMHASQEQHACAMHASRETKMGSRTSDSFMIFS